MVYVDTSTITLSLQITKVKGENFISLSSMAGEREIYLFSRAWTPKYFFEYLSGRYFEIMTTKY